MATQDVMQNINKEIEIALKKASVSIQSEEIIQNLLIVLEQTGLLNEQAKELLKERLFEDFYISLITELLSNITDEQKNSIINAQQAGLSDIQILELQLQIYKKNTGREIEEYAEQLYTEMAERVINELETIKQSVSDVDKLTDDQVRTLDSMIVEGNEEAVLTKLDSFLGNTAENNQTQTTQPTEQVSPYSHVIQLIKDGNLTEAKQELEQIIGTQQTPVSPL